MAREPRNNETFRDILLPAPVFCETIKMFMRDAFCLLLLYLHVVSISFPEVVNSRTCLVN